MAEGNGGLSPQGREELKLVASLGLGHVIAAEAERKAKNMAQTILRGSKGSLNDTLLTMATLLRELVEEHVAIKAHIAELKTKALLMDGGVWAEGMVYEKGEVVTHGGAPWVCLEMNANTRPPGECWRLMGKSHR